jgi:hypothetical protein
MGQEPPLPHQDLPLARLASLTNDDGLKQALFVDALSELLDILPRVARAHLALADYEVVQRNLAVFKNRNRSRG